MRVAVVGSGPAGFYAAGALLSADPPAEVDIIERLPTPWGLVRLGVAPDHPKLKSVSRAFERIADQPGFRFLGNVEVGRDLHHEDLVRLYDAVIYAVGAQTDRRLGIPGEDLPGSWAATEFVAWYNGHPDYQLREFAARESAGKPRRVVFRFFHSPVAILGEEWVEGIELVRNELDANDRAVPTDEHETLSCGLVFRSVGYHGVGLPGVIFDEKSGTIPNEGGRIEPGVYCAGWIKRGPTGVIGTNKKDATETVELLLEDAAAGRPEPKPA